MMGHRAPQRSLFDAQSLPHRVPTDSFYGRMAAISDVVFDDADLSAMYCLDNGRPSLPPALLSGVLLLQFYDDASDAEAVDRLLFDLRWKVALGLPLDYQGFDPSSLVYFRKRLLKHGRERYAFDRFIAVGRAAGFIPDKVTLLTDTTSAQGAGAVQDTYTLIRKAIRKLLKDLGYRLPGKRRGLSAETQALVSTYLAQDQKAAIDWADPTQRAAQLQQLVADESADADVRTSGWMLIKILGDDVVQDAETGPQIGQGPAPDRIISITDPEMRHGRKSRSQLFNGYKVSVSTDLVSDMMLDINDVSARGSDGRWRLRIRRELGRLCRVSTASGRVDNPRAACGESGSR
jgi:transposase